MCPLHHLIFQVRFIILIYWHWHFFSKLENMTVTKQYEISKKKPI